MTEHPRYKLKLRDILFAALRLRIACARGEVESRHSEPLFVDRVVIHWIAVRDMSHAYYRIVPVRPAAVAEGERKIARHNGYFLAI